MTKDGLVTYVAVGSENTLTLNTPGTIFSNLAVFDATLLNKLREFT
jgi:hypothetical protein